METHFEGSRGGDNHDRPHQRQYDEQNPDNVNNIDTDHHHNPEKDQDLASQVVDHPEDVDSAVNTDFNDDTNGEESLTPDESSSTDPNEVPDKPGFNRNENL